MKNKNISKKWMVPALSLLALPAIALAADNFNFQMDIISENTEKLIELLNLIMALVVGVLAIKLAALAQGGTMEKTWNTLAVVSVWFVLIEVVNSLSGFGFVHIGGLSEIIELIFVLTFAYCLYFTKKDLLKKTLG